eukprot:12955629-Alexandrium_andersonii.AAC.1
MGTNDSPAKADARHAYAAAARRPHIAGLLLCSSREGLPEELRLLVDHKLGRLREAAFQFAVQEKAEFEARERAELLEARQRERWRLGHSGPPRPLP